LLHNAQLCQKTFAFRRNLREHSCVSDTDGLRFLGLKFVKQLLVVGVASMFQVQTYRMRADECTQRAREAQDEFHRKNFEQLAAMWAEMADKAESRALQSRRDAQAAVQTIRLAKAS
jgi:hypothetical protein